MESNIANLYVFKALEAYPWELAKAVESLNYALSYEPENVRALCLMAKVHSEQLGDNEAAKNLYERALTVRLDIPQVYPEYIQLLLENEDFTEAQKLIDFAGTVKGIDKGGIKVLQAQLFEINGTFEAAEKVLKEAQDLGLNADFIIFVDGELERVTKKRERQNRNQKEDSLKEVKAETVSNKWMHRLNGLL